MSTTTLIIVAIAVGLFVVVGGYLYRRNIKRGNGTDEIYPLF